MWFEKGLRLTLLALAFAATCAISVAQAQVTQAQAIAAAQQQVGGRVLRVKTNDKHYKIKMLQESGRVVSVIVDRRTGQLLSRSSKRNKE